MKPHHSHSIRPLLFAGISCAISLGSSALAGPLQQAEVHKIVNDVRVVDSQRGSVRPAALRDVIAKDLAVRTGVESRAELLFQDNTLTRLGAETVFSFKPGTRAMNLDKGTMLLQVPKGLGGARIRAAAVTAAITGTTIMIENLPNKSVKVLVLEGSLRLSMNGRFGESVMLKPGKMVIVGPKDRSMPEPVTVDIAKVVKTSALIDPVKFSGGTKTKVSVLPSIDLIEKEIAVQRLAKAKGKMAETNLIIQGNGSDVVMASQETMAALDGPADGSDSRKPSVRIADAGSEPAAGKPAKSQQNTAATASTSGTVSVGVSETVTASGTTTATAGTSGSSGTAGGTAASAGSMSGTSGTGGNVANVANVANAAAANAANNSGSGTSGSGSGTSGSGSGTSGSGTSGSGTSGTSNVAAPTSNSVTANSFAPTTNLTVSSGYLLIGVGGLNTSGHSLSGYDYITVLGNADVGSVTVKNSLSIGGALSAAGAGGNMALSALNIGVGGGIQLNGASNGNGGTLALNASNVLVGVFGIYGISANGADSTLPNTGGGNGGTIRIDTTLSTGTGSVTVSRPISATTGNNGLLVTGGGGNGGTVNITAKDAISVNSTVKVSDSTSPRMSKNGGNIALSSRKTTGTAISIGNSGQLLSLLNSAVPGTPGGTITFVSDGGAILVNGGIVVAERGLVDIRNNGVNGNIQLTNASIRGDTVKIGALGAGGQLLIGGGTIHADTALKLYAGSSTGQVRFTDNVTLGGNGTKAIAGMAVTVDPSKVVTIGGTAPANVYTNTPNFTGSGGNGTSSGTFGGQGATTQPFVQRPTF